MNIPRCSRGEIMSWLNGTRRARCSQPVANVAVCSESLVQLYTAVVNERTKGIMNESGKEVAKLQW